MSLRTTTLGFGQPGDKLRVPVGLLCFWCDEQFVPINAGFVMQYSGDGGADASVAFHLECLVWQLFGGGDPPGMSKRLAAIAAYERGKKS